MTFRDKFLLYNSEKTTFIYSISCDSNIRYIGKSNNPRRRMYQHISEKKNKHKYNWLQLNIRNGNKPIIEVLDEVPMDEWECCRDIIKTSDNFIWRYRDEWIDLSVIGKLKSRTHLPVNQYDLDDNLIERYESVKYASEKLNLRSDNILLCCDKKLKTHKGFVWEFSF